MHTDRAKLLDYVEMDQERKRPCSKVKLQALTPLLKTKRGVSGLIFPLLERRCVKESQEEWKISTDHSHEIKIHSLPVSVEERSVSFLAIHKTTSNQALRGRARTSGPRVIFTRHQSMIRLVRELTKLCKQFLQFRRWEGIYMHSTGSNW